MQLVVAGSSGFVGREVVRQGLLAGHQVFALVRMQGEAHLDEDAVRSGQLVLVPFGAPGEVLREGFGVEPGPLVVNAAGLRRELPRQDLEAAGPGVAREMRELAEDLQALRLIHLSPLLHGEDAFIRAKRKAEAEIRQSTVPTALLRSAPVWGPGDALLDEVGAWMLRSPVIPRFLEEVALDPLDVEDLAQALLAAPPGEYQVGGARLTWGDLLNLAAEAAGKRLWGPRLSPATVLRWARWLGKGRMGSDLVPFTEDGFHRHAQGYQVEDNALPRLLGRDPRPMADYLATEWPYRAGA